MSLSPLSKPIIRAECVALKQLQLDRLHGVNTYRNLYIAGWMTGWIPPVEKLEVV